MGFEDEVEQSFGRPCRQCDGRFKRTHELTSSIVPRGTSFHRGVELDFLLLHWILHRSQAAAAGFVSTCSRLSGSLATFTSRAILPVSSTMQTLVSLTEISSPAKWSMLRFSL